MLKINIHSLLYTVLTPPTMIGFSGAISVKLVIMVAPFIFTGLQIHLPYLKAFTAFNGKAKMAFPVRHGKLVKQVPPEPTGTF